MCLRASGLETEAPARDLSTLTPLMWEHVNPYGRFELDMNVRIPLDGPNGGW